MNLINATVLQVVEEPYERYGVWWQQVLVESYGRNFIVSCMFPTKAETVKLSIGDEIQI